MQEVGCCQLLSSNLVFLKQIGISEQETSEDYTEAFEVNFALHYYNFAKFDYFCGTKQQKHTEMAKYTKQELEEINRQKQALLLLLLKKTRTTRKAVIEAAEEDFIIANLDVLTADERKQFNKLVLN